MRRFSFGRSATFLLFAQLKAMEIDLQVPLATIEGSGAGLVKDSLQAFGLSS